MEQIVLMGGAIAEGNMTPAAEFNIWADPEAAQAVFHAGIATTMIGLDVTHRAVTTPALQERLRSTGTAGGFVADLVDFFTVYHRDTYGWEGAPIHDAVAVAEVIRPGTRDHEERNVEVELESELCRGRTVVDRWHRTSGSRTRRCGIDLDVDEFFELLVERIGAGSGSCRRSSRLLASPDPCHAPSTRPHDRSPSCCCCCARSRSCRLTQKRSSAAPIRSATA